MILTAYDDAH